MKGKVMNTKSDETKKREIIAKIREQFSDVTFPEPVLEPIYYGRLSKNVIENRKAVVDRNTGSAFDIVSDAYELVHHELVLDKLMSSIPEHFGQPKYNVSLFGDGASAFFTFTFPEIKYEVNGSTGEVRFQMRNSYDRSSFLSLSYGLLELVCTNGLVAFRERERSRAKHLDKSISEFDLKEKIESGIGAIEDSMIAWGKWAKIQIPEAHIQEAIAELPFSETEQEKLFRLPLLNHKEETIESLGKKASLWSLNSAATQYANVVAPERRIDIEHKMPAVLRRLESRFA
jgi:hypothetical protein